jgi:tRNA threonylcarbamoyl adenosine modification protein (Sua5/YciO/YrdC/YwlC family)
MLISVNPQIPEPEKIAKIVDILQAGGILVYPTDTIYGLGCDIFNKAAVAKIYRLKKREKHQPLSILCADFKQASQFAQIPNHAFKLMKKALPGPYTFILKAKNKTPQNFLAKNKTVGIRIPGNKICLAIVKKLNAPIITTSLNISGEKPLSNPQLLPKEFKNQIDLVIDAGDLPIEPSTVIDLTTEKPKVLRLGKGKIFF